MIRFEYHREIPDDWVPDCDRGILIIITRIEEI